MSMETGIYEQIINRLFECKIKSLNQDVYYIGKSKITKDNATLYLSRYLFQIIQQAINALPNDDMLVDKSIKIINDIIEKIVSDFNIRDFNNNLIDARAYILTAVIDKTKNDYPDVAEYIKSVMPATKLTQSTLFTGRNTELNMVSELKKEIQTADEICLLVSFIKSSGLSMIIKELRDFVNQGKKLRVITTTYIGATHYRAIVELAKLPNTQIKISYNCDVDRLHAKSYLFLRNSQYHTAYVGSSNISSAALTQGLEWNIKVTQTELPQIISTIKNTFDTYWLDDSFETFTLGKDDSRLKAALKNDNYSQIDYSVLDLIKAKDYQTEVLDRLTAERQIHGNFYNLLVAATGTGKTVIAAFDYKRFKENNTHANFLFVAHREEILKQAQDTFRRILGDENFGELWYANNKPYNYNHIFASKDTLNNRLSDNSISLQSDYYDFIIIDEAHHISADSYQKIINRFKPKILLGLTATPERMDNKDITEYFNNRISAEIRLTDALNNGLLSPFHYYGVTDCVDLSNVKWERGHFVASELSKIYTNNDQRTSVIWKAMERYLSNVRDVRALCFCVTQEHAKYMNAKFTLAGLRCGVLTSDNAVERSAMLKKLQQKKINYLFVVDMFNEGVDIPSIDTVLFLRPTESLTIFLQQLGRGLRKSEGKEYLTILDFVGNSRSEFNYNDRFRALMGKTSMSVSEEISRDFPHLPLNCHIELEKVAKERVLSNIDSFIRSFSPSKIKQVLRTFTQTHNLPLTLKNFTTIYHIPLERIYKSITWTELCMSVNVIPTENYEMSKNLQRAVYRKWLAAESYSYFSFIDKLAQNYFNSDFNRLTNIEQKMALMLYYDLYQDAGRFATLQDMFNSLSQQPLFCNEVHEIMQILMDKSDVLELQDNSAFSMINPLKLHARYTKDQILVALETSTLQRKSPCREGVEYNKDRNIEAMFVDVVKNREVGSNTNYNDYAQSRNLFHWESQNRVHSQTMAGKRYISGSQIMLLFVREQSDNPEDKNRTMGYIYLGQVKMVSWKDGSPMKIVWKLQTSMPASVYSFACKFKAIG